MKRKRRTTDSAKRAAAVERIVRGESSIEDEAARLHVKPAAVKAWVTMKRRGTSPGRPKASERGVQSDPFEGPEQSEGATPRLDRALRSALGGPSEEEEGEIGSDIPPPDPESLVLFTETIRGMGLRIYAGVLGLSEQDPRLKGILSFTESDRATLRLCAPYAAEYVPMLIGRSKEVGAWIYLGVTVASLWRGMASLKAMARAEKPHRSPEDPFGPRANASPTEDPKEPWPPSGARED